MEPGKDAGLEDRVWDIYKSLTAQCQHFNSLESTYRTLASTWLLAAFAGIGFVLKDIPRENWALYIAAIAGAAAVGIFLLWLMDLMVYHRLLGAAFAEQMALEKQYSWLPKVAHGMMSAHGGAGVVPKIVWFYIAPYTLLVGIASVAAVRGATPTWSMPAQRSYAWLAVLLFSASQWHFICTFRRQLGRKSTRSSREHNDGKSAQPAAGA